MAALTATTTAAAVPNYIPSDGIQNLGPADVYVGPVGVTAATGIKILPGGYRDNIRYAPYVITLAGTADVRHDDGGSYLFT